jgi:thiol-disulfide isomerase/thioredoxin
MRYGIFIALALSLWGCDVSSPRVDDERGQPLTTIEGKTWRFSDYQGKWIVVNYWASWCKPCITEVPALNAFYQEYKDRDVVVLGVNYDFASGEETQKLSQTYQISYPVLASEYDPREQLGVEPDGITHHLYCKPRRRDCRDFGGGADYRIAGKGHQDFRRTHHTSLKVPRKILTYLTPYAPFFRGTFASSGIFCVCPGP